MNHYLLLIITPSGLMRIIHHPIVIYVPRNSQWPLIIHKYISISSIIGSPPRLQLEHSSGLESAKSLQEKIFLEIFFNRKLHEESFTVRNVE